MERIGYELLNQRINADAIESEYYAKDTLVYSIEKTAEGDQVYFFNPEFAFEKQRLENADAAKVFTYLEAHEKFPEQYRVFLAKGIVFLKIASADLSRFVRHIFK